MATPPAHRTAAYDALVRGILTVERRIAPLWTVDLTGLSPRERVVRERVTANCLRELDVLLDHWVGDGRLGSEDRDDAGDPDGVRQPATYRSDDILAIAATYWTAAHAPGAMHRCHLLT